MILEKTHKITLFNDDEHSFEYITACLIEFCKHDAIQALQCAYIVDGVGEYDIINGEFDKVFDIKLELEKLGLKVEITENESDLY